jgi:pyridinium-3,5-biscarboxylic acid mononucleotide synthase
MDDIQIKNLIAGIQSGQVSSEAALHRLRKLPFEDLGYAKVDHHRCLRNGVPEVIYCEGKAVEHVKGIIEMMLPHHNNILATRADNRHYEAIRSATADCRYHEAARIVVVKPRSVEEVGRIAVVCAGTSDIPVAEEAAITAATLGNRVDRLYDVGVAGLHRLLDSCEALFKANVAIVIAGMEGALASVVGGLVACPVIGVPTSVGYGASFGGIAALLSMLNSCASGVSVVNIDNGFGAGYQASLINKIAVGHGRQARHAHASTEDPLKPSAAA